MSELKEQYINEYASMASKFCPYISSGGYKEKCLMEQCIAFVGHSVIRVVGCDIQFPRCRMFQKSKMQKANKLKEDDE